MNTNLGELLIAAVPFVSIGVHSWFLIRENKNPGLLRGFDSVASDFASSAVFAFQLAQAVAAAAFFERFTRERTVSDGLAPLETQ